LVFFWGGLSLRYGLRTRLFFEKYKKLAAIETEFVIDQVLVYSVKDIAGAAITFAPFISVRPNTR
jgi:hypothetical protein